MKPKVPFTKNEHIQMIKAIALGLKQAGFLENYLEIGIKKGYCFNKVAPLAKHAYGVDILDCHSLIKQNKNLIWYHGRSEDFLKSHRPDVKFDLVFIDGAHEHSASLQDFKLVLPHTREGGLILFHDTYPPTKEFTQKKYCFDTYKTAEYIKAHYPDYEFATLPFYYGISIFRNTKRQLLWKR